MAKLTKRIQVTINVELTEGELDDVRRALSAVANNRSTPGDEAARLLDLYHQLATPNQNQDQAQNQAPDLASFLA